MISRLLCLSLLVLSATSFAQEPKANPWVGIRVMPKIGCELKEKGQTIKDSKVNRVPYRVIQTEGEWLLVGDRQPGWVRTSDIVTLDKAIDYYTQEIKKSPKSTLPYIRRAITYQEQREWQKAIADYSQAITMEPKNASALSNRGTVLSQIKGESDKALADFDAALKLDPNFVSAYVARGSLHYAVEKYNDAAVDLAKAVELDPGSALAHYCYATTLEAQGKIAEAIKEYELAIKSNPRDPLAYSNLAWIMATSFDDDRRDGKRGVELASKACELTNWKDAESIDTLAAAHAEAGNWDKAIQSEEAALKLVPKDRQEAMQARLDLYKKKIAFRAQ